VSFFKPGRRRLSMPEIAAPTPVAPDSDETETPASEASVELLLVADDLIVEEVSIDGMCGVY
jgi:mycofactocin precursor